MSAYACAPRRGSEPGAGWGFVRSMAEHHDVWVITRRKNQPEIEKELAHDGARGLHLVYYDFPQWVLALKKG